MDTPLGPDGRLLITGSADQDHPGPPGDTARPGGLSAGPGTVASAAAASAAPTSAAVTSTATASTAPTSAAVTSTATTSAATTSAAVTSTPAAVAGGLPRAASALRRARRRGISAEVADHIRTAIFNGTLKPGQRVPQDAIAAELGISRVPVREALIALEGNGLVASEPNRGMFVVPIRQEDIEDHYRMYGMIQGLAASRAVHRITEPVLERLAELHRQMCSSTDPDLLRDLNYEFHYLINKTGGSTRVRSVLRHLSHNLPRELYYLSPGASPEANRGHHKILDALRRGDGPAADAANREHVELEGATVVVALKQNGILTD